MTLKELPEYESPVPAVVVAPDETSPPNTASPPLERDERFNAPLIVEDAVEKNPLVRPKVVEVELYPTFEVNGKTEAARVEVETVPTIPFEPMYE